MQPLRLAAVGALLCLTTSACMAASVRSLTVEAGAYDRTNTLISFPAGSLATDPRPWRLTGPDGRQIPVQMHEATAWFIEPGLARSTTRRYRLESGAASPATTAPDVQRQEGLLTLRVDHQPAATFVAGPGRLPRDNIRPEFLRGGYLHPLVTPSGRIVTDDYPPNHIHHHGIWTSWTRTRFEGRAPDFWNMGERKGRTDFESLGTVVEGPVFCGFQAELNYSDLLVSPPRPALREQWTVRLPAIVDPRFRVLDFSSEQRCAGDSPLELPKYYYGGFAYRGPMAWNGPDAALYLDSNGVTQRKAANETRVRWHWLGGLVDGQVAGVAVLGHPENFRAPQPVRIHPTEPFTCNAPSQLGDWAIRPGETHRMRYRLVLLDGEPDAGLLDRLWNDYAHPPVARLE